MLAGTSWARKKQMILTLTLVSTDLLESLSDPWAESGILEVLGAELLEGVVVEGILEVLKGKSVLEDDGVEGGIPLLHGSWGSRDHGSRDGCDESGELSRDHFD